MVRPELETALGRDGVVLARRGRLGELAARAAASGELVRLLPGAYARTHDWRTRCVALARTDPDAVVAGRAAAALSWWKDTSVDAVAAYRSARPRAGYRWLRGQVPDALTVVRRGVRITTPSLTVLDLVPELGGEAIDQALRRRAVTLAELRTALALTPGRPGNAERARLIDDSRDEPWSPLERAFHRRLWTLEIPWPWRTNVGVALDDDRIAYLDVAIPALKLGLEVDGWAYHSTHEAFQRDRSRDQELAERGWQVVRFTDADVRDSRLVAAIRRMAAARATQLGLEHTLTDATMSRRILADRAAERRALSGEDPA